MTALGFLLLTRDAGQAVLALCAEVAAAARPGDRVVMVDDGGDADNAAPPARFVTAPGFGSGVRVTRLVTGTRGAGDTAVAANLALAEAAADPGLAQALLLPARARLDPLALAAARALPGDPALVLAPEAGAPWTGAMIVARRLIAGREALRLEEGCNGGGSLGFLWRARARAAADPGGIACAPAAFATLAASEVPGPEWVWAATALASTGSHDPDLGAWLWRGLARGLAASSPGATLALAAPLAALARRLPPPADCTPEVMRRRALAPPPAPPVTGRAPLRIAALGPHRHRMPPAYPALARFWEGRIAPADPAVADLVLFAHPQDPRHLDPATARAITGRTLALFSEEPFWDSLFSPNPLAPAVTLTVGHLGDTPFWQRNHHTSPVFAFDRLPYLTLTEPRFAAAYARAFPRNAALAPEDWQAAFAARPLRAAFMAERRPEPFHDMAWPAGGIVGLCAWRTRLADGYGTGRVARFGASWQGGPTRFELIDWHGDKLTRLDGQARLISAIENTHQPAYVSEKLFDAFACGARPLYMAGPGHRVHDLGLPSGAWINLWGLDSSVAPEVIDEAPWDGAFLAAYAEAQAALARLWTDPARIDAERSRIARAVVADLTALADLGSA